MTRSIPKRRYEAELLHLQAELTTMTEWVKETGAASSSSSRGATRRARAA